MIDIHHSESTPTIKLGDVVLLIPTILHYNNGQVNSEERKFIWSSDAHRFQNFK